MKKETKSTILISGVEYPVIVKDIPPSELKFWVDNPRIYSIVHATREPLDQCEIEKELRKRDHVKELRKDILHHGGVIHPLLVQSKNGVLEVIEGNSRLAAYRVLQEEDPIKWNSIRCQVVSDIPLKAIYSYLNQEHIKGKTEWSPYEQAGVIYRLVETGTKLEDLPSEHNIKKPTALRMYETYKFMVENDEDDPTKWSYYEVYLQNQKAKKRRKSNSDLDKRIVHEIRSKKLTAQQFREILPLVCENSKAFNKFLSEKTNLAGAHEQLEEEGKTESVHKRLQQIYKQVFSIEAKDLEKLPVRAAKDAEFKISKMITRLQSVKRKVFEKN